MIYHWLQLGSKFLCEASQRALPAQFFAGQFYNGALGLEERMLTISQNQSLEELRNVRRIKLQKIIIHASKNVRFYKELFAENKIDSEKIKNETDLQSLPVVTKKFFFNNNPAHILAKNIPYSRIFSGTTSGSTGEPIRYFKDKKYLAVTKAKHYRPWRWAGVSPSAPIVHCSAPHAASGTPNTVFLHPHKIKENIADYIEKIRKSGAKAMRGYPLTNFEIARTIKEFGAEDIKFAHAFFVGHALSNGIREFFENEFGCEIYNIYASLETDAIAAECEQHDGLHINEESLIVEILDEKNNPVSTGDKGRIIVTVLTNEVMPLIRYDTGDIGMILPDKCLCGRTLRRMLVEGRIEDLLLRPDGQIIYPGIIRDIVDEYFHVFERYQFEQISSCEIIFRIVPTQSFSNEKHKKAIKEVRECIGPLINIRPEIVDAIPILSSGKFKYFISDEWRKKFQKDFFEYHLPEGTIN